MASSIIRFTPAISRAAAAAAAQSCLRRMLCTAITNSSVNRVAPPWLMLPPSSSAEGGDAAAYNMYSLSHGKAVRLHNPKPESELRSESDEAKVVGSSHGWLALLNQSGGDLFLRNPITSQNIKLPPLDNLICGGRGGGVSKVILSCPPGEGEGEEDDRCLAAVAFAGGRQLAFCRPGRSGEWTPFGGGLSFETSRSRFYPDFAYLSRHRLFFCLAQFYGEEGFAVETWYLHHNAGGDAPPRAVSSVGCAPIFHEERGRTSDRLRRYTVYAEDSDRLFLVTRLLGDAGETAGFDVHRFSCSFGWIGEWRADSLCYMEDSLDGLVMFVGANGSFALPAADFPELKPNSIYFSGDDGDVEVFDYGSKTVSPCYYPFDESRRSAAAAPPPLWFTPTALDVVPAADSVVSSGGGGFRYESKIEV